MSLREKCRREKCRREKCHSGRNVAGRKVAGRNVSQGEMSYNHFRPHVGKAKMHFGGVCRMFHMYFAQSKLNLMSSINILSNLIISVCKMSELKGF